MSEQISTGLVDGTTGQPIAAPTPTTPAVSGATHQTSGPGKAPDPTGLRGTLQKNADTVRQKLASAGTAAVAEQNAAKPAAVSRETQAPKLADGTQRGPDGKFLPKGTPLAAEPAEDAPPSSWRTETKALWKEIDAKFLPEQAKMLKDELRKRENDFRSGLAAKDTESAQFKQFHEQINPVIAPRLQHWQQMGVSPQQAIANLVGLEARFQSNPIETIKWLANAAKIDLSTLSGGNQQAAQQADPQLAPIMQTINGLSSKLQQLESGWTGQKQATDAAEIQSVIDEKGADGQPVRPHFNDVMAEIQDEMSLLQRKEPNLSARQMVIKAYDNAVFRNPDIRQKMLDGVSATKRASEDAEQRQRAAELAAKNVRGGPPNVINGAVDPSNLRAGLEARIRPLYAGGQRI